MATNTTTKQRSRARGAAAAAPSSIDEQVKMQSIGEVEDVQKTPQKQTSVKAVKKKAPSYELTDSVLVRNGYHGPLIIALPKSGYTLKLASFGDEDYIEIGDLRTLRNSHPKFFKKNWLLFDDPDVIEYLHVEEFYKNALSIDGIDELFNMDIDDAVAKIAILSDGQKKTVAYTAMEKIDLKEMDSIAQIKAFEKALGCALMEDMG